eukprot:379301-Karenia_brevis.AAC.1
MRVTTEIKEKLPHIKETVVTLAICDIKGKLGTIEYEQTHLNTMRAHRLQNEASKRKVISARRARK